MIKNPDKEEKNTFLNQNKVKTVYTMATNEDGNKLPGLFTCVHERVIKVLHKTLQLGPKKPP